MATKSKKREIEKATPSPAPKAKRATTKKTAPAKTGKTAKRVVIESAAPTVTTEPIVAEAVAAVTGTLYIGCAIWAYDGWAEIFFPKGTPKDKRLNAYAQRLTGVEINSTFYAVPAVPVVKKWAEEVPETFRFCPKFPKAITHTAQLVNVEAQTTTFIGTMRVLGTRLGPLMLQLPPSFGPMRLPTLQKFLEGLPTDLEIAVEVRHPEWFKEDNAAKLDKVLADRKASRVVFDVRPAHESDSPDASPAQEKKPDVPLIAVASQPYVVVRYIASPVPEENAQYFEEWIPRLTTWLNEGRRVYFFVHCPLEERSPEFAREVYHRLSKVVQLPALPWDVIEPPQATEAETKAELVTVQEAAEPSVEAVTEPLLPDTEPVKKPSKGKKAAEKIPKAASEPSAEADQEEKPDKPVQLTLF